jgi:formamidopyrimidine-DNA glycosylase
MPELPEVETIVLQLKKKIVGKTIKSIEILDYKMIEMKVKTLVPCKIIDVYRRAKSIIIQLNKGNNLLVHLRMTGHFHYVKKNQIEKLKPYEKFIVAKFNLNDGSLLTHNSIRKFGSIKLFNDSKLDQELSRLGVEPLSKEFTLNKFKGMLSNKLRANIKTTLMDQHFLVGIGNIYVQEALYNAKIAPQRKINTLKDKEIGLLYNSIREILSSAIKHQGTTVENYVHIEGSGGFQKFLSVYNKSVCPKKHPLKKMNLGGRGTSYCPICQK